MSDHFCIIKEATFLNLSYMLRLPPDENFTWSYLLISSHRANHAECIASALGALYLVSPWKFAPSPKHQSSSVKWANWRDCWGAATKSGSLIFKTQVPQTFVVNSANSCDWKAQLNLKVVKLNPIWSQSLKHCTAINTLTKQNKGNS